MKRILIVEDDTTYSLMLKTWLKKKEFEVETAGNIKDAQKILNNYHIDLILSDLRLPDHDGISLLEWMNVKKNPIQLIIMTGYEEIQTDVQAMKLGAKDYVSKPINPDELLKKIIEALKVDTQQPLKNISLKENKAKVTIHQEYLEGESDAAKELYHYVKLVAPTPMSVLINGASGTGKEYIAHRIHQLSKRSDKPFIAIDCGAIPKELAASEFFGHIKGSFTGAINDKTGAFLEANGGTLFLDEVGNLNYETQIQLLRALQERKIKPIGSNQEIMVDIRLITATNENLENAISNGTFREDLYHRINEFTIRMPQLKDRKEDILHFANFFLDQANQELDKHIFGFDNEASIMLLQYNWPGNLRQMKNIIRRATLLANNDYITASELKQELNDINEVQASISINDFSLKNPNTERERILEALKQTGNNKSRAAQLLNIDRKTLYNKLKLYHIE